ncbi:MAG TPA: lipopolysaccharide transport periplasmic protein LptA [Gammaproteobacteria bacterium]|nr:lipopolysaccharide transport periplasmic protein LptA [Gammaproteobacteria bacterium]
MCESNKWRFLLLVCTLCVAASAWALKSDKSQPINIQSDHGDFQSDAGAYNGTGVYTGNVIITQGSIRITADKAILHTLNGEIQTADITGAPATFQQQPDAGPLSHGMANEITYDATKNEVVLTGNAHVQQDERQITGDVIRYSTDTEHVTASGGKTSGGRINITIPPKQVSKNPPAKARHKKKKHRKLENTPPQANPSQSTSP